MRSIFGEGSLRYRGTTPPRNLLRFAAQISTLPQGEVKSYSGIFHSPNGNSRTPDSVVRMM
jgi:hypothetical protein